MARKQNQTTAGSEIKLPEAPAEKEATFEQEGPQKTTESEAQHEASVEAAVLAEAPVAAKEEQTFSAPTDQVRHKKFRIDRNGEGLWVIKMEGGGKLPGKLSGAYTAHAMAEQAVEVYLRG